MTRICHTYHSHHSSARKIMTSWSSWIMIGRKLSTHQTFHSMMRCWSRCLRMSRWSHVEIEYYCMCKYTDLLKELWSVDINNISNLGLVIIIPVIVYTAIQYCTYFSSSDNPSYPSLTIVCGKSSSWLGMAKKITMAENKQYVK